MVFLSIAGFTAFMRIQGTLVGYEIGDLKDKESLLLDQLSGLKMNLAKQTSKKNLIQLASAQSNHMDPFESMASLEPELNSDQN